MNARYKIHTFHKLYICAVHVEHAREREGVGGSSRAEQMHLNARANIIRGLYYTDGDVCVCVCDFLTSERWRPHLFELQIECSCARMRIEIEMGTLRSQHVWERIFFLICFWLWVGVCRL